jgi:hypothetical protein
LRLVLVQRTVYYWACHGLSQGMRVAAGWRPRTWSQRGDRFTFPQLESSYPSTITKHPFKSDSGVLGTVSACTRVVV